MSKLSDAREFVQMYGVNYGWEWDKAKGLTYTPTGFGDEWDLANDAAAGDWAAQELVNAINMITVKEHNDALHNINRRKQPNANELTDRYEHRAKELLLEHRADLRATANSLERLMLAQNYHRASEYNPEGEMIALRQNPRALGTLTGLEQRVNRSADIIFKTITNSRKMGEMGIDSDEMSAAMAVLKAMGRGDIATEFQRRVAKIYDGDYSEDSGAKTAKHGTYFYTLAEEIYGKFEEEIQEVYNKMSVVDREEIISMKEMGTLAAAMGL